VCDENLLAGMKMFRETLTFCKTSRKILDIYVSTNERTNKQKKNKQTNEQTNKQMNEQTNKKMNEQTNKRTNKRTNKGTNKQMNE
jgi:hypothetical protein